MKTGFIATVKRLRRRMCKGCGTAGHMVIWQAPAYRLSTLADAVYSVLAILVLETALWHALSALLLFVVDVDIVEWMWREIELGVGRHNERWKG